MTDTTKGSGDIKIKLYLAVKELVGAGSLTERLTRATRGIHTLLEHDLPAPLAERFMVVRHRLTVEHKLLEDHPVTVGDSEGADLAGELLAVFAMVCDPSKIGIWVKG